MTILFTFFLFILTILLPCLYFIYVFHKEKRYLCYFFIIAAIYSTIMLLIKFFHIYTSLIYFLIYISWFYTILSLFFLVLLFLYRLYKTSISYRMIICLSILSLIMTSYGFYHHYDKQLKTYDITIHKTSTLNQLSIGMISDLHLGTGTTISDVKKLVTTANQQHFDIMFLCGDIYDESTALPLLQETLSLLSQIKTTYGIYAISGNHEFYTSIQDASLYTHQGIHYLSNEYECIDNTLNIVGREDLQSKDGVVMDTICQNMDQSLPTIILDHNPKRYKENISFGDIQLSGHTHNGQVIPGNIVVNALYDDAYGLLEVQNMNLIVTSGYGSWGFPYRLGTQCELVKVNITFSKN